MAAQAGLSLLWSQTLKTGFLMTRLSYLQEPLTDTYMPYLTLWAKISQNLAHLEASSHKIFQISQNFQTILQHILWRNKHKLHFVVFIKSFLHLKKGFWLFWGSSRVTFVKITQNFIKSHLKICLISDFSPELICKILTKTDHWKPPVVS